jgi:hypothetical protein
LLLIPFSVQLFVEPSSHAFGLDGLLGPIGPASLETGGGGSVEVGGGVVGSLAPASRWLVPLSRSRVDGLLPVSTRLMQKPRSHISLLRQSALDLQYSRLS